MTLLVIQGWFHLEDLLVLSHWAHWRGAFCDRWKSVTKYYQVCRTVEYLGTCCLYVKTMRQKSVLQQARETGSLRALIALLEVMKDIFIGIVPNEATAIVPIDSLLFNQPTLPGCANTAQYRLFSARVKYIVYSFAYQHLSRNVLRLCLPSLHSRRHSGEAAVPHEGAYISLQHMNITTCDFRI